MDYTPEWRLREEGKQAQAGKEAAPQNVPRQEPPGPPKQPDPEEEPNPSQGLEYQLTGKSKGLGMVELDANGVVGGADEETELPPGR